MSKDILDEFGPNSKESQAARASEGGCCHPTQIPYSPPKGPTGMMKQGPGLGGTTHMCGTQGKH